MDYSQFIFALAVIIIGVVRWFIENRNNSANEERRDNTDSDLPEWTWPSAEEEQTPPHLPSTTPPPPPTRSTRVPIPPQRHAEVSPPPPPSNRGSLSSLQQKIAEAKKRGQKAEAQRMKFTSKAARKQIKSATHTPHGVNWLRDPESLRRAVIAREILGPPLALREDPDSEIR